MSQKCSKPSCSRLAQTAGLCRPHYQFSTRGIPTGRVDPAPVIAHIRALQAAGIPTKRIGQLVDIPQNNIWAISAGRRGFVLAPTAVKILSIPLPDTPWLLANNGTPVPIVGTQRRLHALMAHGYTGRYLADCLGVHHNVITKVSAGSQELVTTKVAKATAELFKKLQMTPGPSEISRRRARARGWLPPFAWDEDTIDDPDAQPQLPSDDKDSWFDDYRELRDLGLTHRQVAERWGIHRQSLNTKLRRLNLPTHEYERYIA